MSGEEKIPLVAYLVRKKCPRCKEGKMEFILETEELDEYAHQCTECALVQRYDKVYPHFAWEELEIRPKN